MRYSRPMLFILRRLRVVALGAAALTLTVGSALGQVGAQPFDAFSGDFGLGGESDVVTVSAQYTAPQGGKPGMLFITAAMKPGWHIYSISQPSGGPKPTQIKLDPSEQYRLVGQFAAHPAPESKKEPIFDGLMVQTHHDTVTWHAPIQLAEGVDPRSLRIEGRIQAQPCEADRCLAPQDFPFVAALGPGVELPAGQPGDGAAKPAPRSALPRLAEDQTLAVAAQFTGPEGERPAELQVAVAIKPDWYIYSLTQPEGGPNKSVIDLEPSDQYEMAGELRPTSGPKRASDPAYPNLVIEKHYTQVVWRAPLRLAEGVDPAKLQIAGTLKAQPCTADKCLAPQKLPFTAALGPGFATAGDDAKSQEGAAGSVAPLDPGDLALKLALAFAGGLILNLMPCVLPVISLKLFSFLEQAGERRARVLALNLWYTLGLLSVFLVLAAFTAAVGQAWGEQFTQAWFKIGLTALVFVMALSFLGVWEIPIPGFVGSGAASDLQRKEGALGAFFKGAFATILATPCSGPFLGSLFGFLLGQPAYVVYLIFGFVGLGMASPYLVIGAFPHLIRFLPRPGAWMETFKEVMGFLLLGTVVFLFSTISDKYFVPTLTLLVGLWFACWLIGRTPITASVQAKAAAWLGGIGTAAVVGLLAFTVLLYESKMPWKPFSPEALAQARSEGKTVMVDFTADWCLTCKTNLKLAIDTPKVRELVEENDVVPLLADWTDESPMIKEALNELGYNSIPVLAIWPAGESEPIVLVDLLSQSQVVEALQEAGPSRGTPKAKAEQVAME